MKGQSWWESALENVLNVGSGVIVAMLAWHFIITPIWGFKLTIYENFKLTVLMTVISLIRGMIWRRYFNNRMVTRMGQWKKRKKLNLL